VVRVLKTARVQRELGVALFGRAGEQKLRASRPVAVPAAVVEEARQRFGLVVAPTPG
jgi:hypothetical protein